ncbi:MAG: DUF4931 domain-containing protein [Candidatus Diapherotrites archaeon]|nr:DUF4931 domain-containing protein [Candidatus Diapherotrites archaeon]
MHEYRKDYITGSWVIIATSRSQRPHHLKAITKRSPKSKCPFCPEHEDWTPAEIKRYPENAKSWRIRVVPNKFPAVLKRGKIGWTKEMLLERCDAVGVHEVIIETSDHRKDLCDLPEGDISDLIKVYRERFVKIVKDNRIKEVTIFKNQGASAGASLSHAHSQIIATNRVSERLDSKIRAFESYKRKHKICPYCKAIEKELNSKRMVYSGKNVVAFTPFASRAAYELWIFPREHVPNIGKMSDGTIDEFASVLKKALLALKSINADFNYFFQMPCKGDFHMHLCISPRVIQRAGFEEATECIINIVSPEEAATLYRKNIRAKNAEN